MSNRHRKRPLAKPIRVLFIDDDPEALAALEKIAIAQGWDATAATSALGAAAIVDERDIEVVVSDHFLPQLSGIDFLMALKTTHPDVVRILMSAAADKDMAARAVMDGGVHAVIPKPFGLQSFVTTVRTAAMHARSLHVTAAPDARSAVRAFKR